MNNKINKTFLSVLSALCAVLTVFFFVQIVVKANTPLSTTVSDNTEDSFETENFNDSDDDSVTPDYDREELQNNVLEFIYDNYKDMVLTYGRNIGVAYCNLNNDSMPEILFSNYPQDVDFDCFIDVVKIEDNELTKIDTLTGRFEAYQGDDGVYLVGTNNGKKINYKLSTLGNKLSRTKISKSDIPSSVYENPLNFYDGTNDIKEYFDDSDDDSDSDDLSDAYLEYCIDNYSQNAKSGSQVEVGFYDINDDGVTEMIISSGASEAEWSCTVCSYEDDEVYMVDSIYGHYDFYEAESGKGVYLVTGHQGNETIKRLTMNKSGDKLITQTISEKILDDDEDYYSNDNPIELKDITEELEDY